MSRLGDKIVLEARLLVDTPFVHQGRLGGPSGGCDCAGMVKLICDTLGLEVEDRTDYARETDGTLHNLLSDSPNVVKVDTLQSGDMIEFWMSHRGKPQHISIYDGTTNSLIHALGTRKGGQVRVESFDQPFWQKRVVAYWRHKEAC